MDKKNKNNIAKILLAFGVLASPMMLANQVSADNSIVNTNANNIETNTESNAVTTENVINENKENKKEEKTQPEATATENNKAEATEEATTKENTATDTTVTTSQAEEKSDENAKIVEIKEEVDFKLDASQRHELKEAGYTDEEIQSIENSIKKSLTEDSKFNVYDFVASKVNAKKAEKEPAAENTTAEKETNALGISEEKAPEALQAGDENRAPKDISNEVTNIEGSIEGLINKNATTIKPIAQDPNLEGKDYDTQAEAHVSFDVPNSTIEGDYVDI